MRKLITLSILAAATIASADPVHGIRLQPSGSNFIVIHEYGSKKIFSEGSLAMGDSSDTLVGTAGLGTSGGDLRNVPISKNYVGQKEKTTDVEFSKITPSHYSYFVHNSNVSPYMTTSFYFTGEGRLSEGGTNSKVFKNKYNINNLLSYCSIGKKVDCINFLNQFNEDSSIYMVVRNGATNTENKDKTRLNKLEDIVMNGSIDESTRTVAKARLAELKRFLKLAWSIEPIYYNQYDQNQISPYMFMTIANNNIVGNNITANNNLAYGIRGALPYLHTSAGLYNPRLYIDGNQKYLSFSQIVPAERHGRRRGLFGRSRYYSCAQGTLINGNQCLITNAQNSLNLSDTEKLLSSYGSSSFSALAQTGVSAGMVGRIYVSNDRSIQQQNGSRTNRGTTDFVNANYLTYAKSGVNSFNANKSFANYYTDAKRKEIAANLANVRANSLRIYEVNYGVSAKPMQTSSGTGITQSATFAKTSDVFQMENFFDANKNDIAFISRMNSFINFNDEAYNPKETMGGMHDLDEEGFFLAGKGKEQAKATTYPGKYNDEIGNKSYSTSLKLDLFYTPNNMSMGYKTKFGIDESYRLTNETNGNKDVTPELGVANINNETLSNTVENSSVINNHFMQDEYASFTSCLLDDACFAYFMSTESGTYDEVSKFATESLILPDSDYPLRLNTERKLQTVYTPDEKGIYQFFGPKVEAPKYYCGAYMDDENKKQEWCIVAYEPKTTKLEFKERSDTFYRYKQDANDNFFYLLPKNELGGATDTAITLSNNTPKIGRSVKSVEPTASYKEDYSIYATDGENKMGAYDYTLTRVDVGNGNQLPDHRAEKAKADDDDLFINKAERPDWMHMQMNYRSAIEGYLDSYLKDQKYQQMACGMGSSEDEESGTVTNEDPTKKIGFANCKALMDTMKNYTLNDFTSEKYLTKYQGNYKLLTTGKLPSPYNKFGMVYNLDSEDAIEQNSNGEAQENKRRDVARSLTEAIMDKYWSKFETDQSPDSEYRQWLIENAKLPEKKYDYNQNSKLNKCAKKSGWGLPATVTGEKPMPFSDCLKDLSDSKWTPDPTIEKEVNGVVYNPDGSVKEDTPEDKERRAEAEKELIKYGIDPRTLRSPGFYKRWSEVVPNKVYMLEYGALGNNYFGEGTYRVSVDLNRYIKDFSMIDKMWVDAIHVDDWTELFLNGKHLYGYPKNVPGIVHCRRTIPDGSGTSGTDSEGGDYYWFKWGVPEWNSVGSYNNCKESYVIGSMENETSHKLGRLGINYASYLDPDSNIISSTLLVGGRGEVYVRLIFEYKDETEGPKSLDLTGSFWSLTNKPLNNVAPVQTLYINKKQNPHIDFRKSSCEGASINSIKGNYSYGIVFDGVNPGWDVQLAKCKFKTKLGGDIDFNLVAGKTVDCGIKSGAQRENCFEVQAIKPSENETSRPTTNTNIQFDASGCPELQNVSDEDMKAFSKQDPRFILYTFDSARNKLVPYDNKVLGSTLFNSNNNGLTANLVKEETVTKNGYKVYASDGSFTVKNIKVVRHYKRDVNWDISGKYCSYSCGTNSGTGIVTADATVPGAGEERNPENVSTSFFMNNQSPNYGCRTNPGVLIPTYFIDGEADKIAGDWILESEVVTDVDSGQDLGSEAISENKPMEYPNYIQPANVGCTADALPAGATQAQREAYKLEKFSGLRSDCKCPDPKYIDKNVFINAFKNQSANESFLFQKDNTGNVTVFGDKKRIKKFDRPILAPGQTWGGISSGSMSGKACVYAISDLYPNGISFRGLKEFSNFGGILDFRADLVNNQWLTDFTSLGIDIFNQIPYVNEIGILLMDYDDHIEYSTTSPL